MPLQRGLKYFPCHSDLVCLTWSGGDMLISKSLTTQPEKILHRVIDSICSSQSYAFKINSYLYSNVLLCAVIGKRAISSTVRVKSRQAIKKKSFNYINTVVHTCTETISSKTVALLPQTIKNSNL